MGASNLTNQEHLWQDAQFIDQLRQRMFSFAKLQIGDEHLAEDAVHEAFAAALKNSESFAGQALFQTWVFAILKHKISDVLRAKGRTLSLADEDNDDSETRFFAENGHWKQQMRPTEWHGAEQAALSNEFWDVFTLCLDNLPADQARVFMMREFIEMECSQICTNTGMSLSNVYVLLHRARLKLRNCLQRRWFIGAKSC